MAEINYADILNQSWDNIPVPKILPSGSWRLRLKSANVQAPKGKDGNPSVLFVYEAQEPMDDVDSDAIKALGDGYDYAIRPLFHRVWLGNANDVNRLRGLIQKHGADVSGLTVGESLKAIQNAHVVAIVGERSYPDASGELQTENTVGAFAEA